MGKLVAGMLVRVVGTSDVGSLVLVREAAQTCVIKLTRDGTLRKNVPLDDVEEARESETPRSPPRLLALPPSTTAGSSSPAKKLAVGDAVKARYKNGAKWFDGTIAKVRADGTYDVQYDDGDVETRVDAACVERKAAALSPVKSPMNKAPRFSVGDKIKARYKKGAKLFSGKIAKSHADGTYDVKYDDGDVETRVEASYIQRDEEEKESTVAVSPKKSGAAKPRAQIGDKVKARYKKGAKLYGGVITRIHSDGTFAIKYEDGDVESRVEAKYIEFSENAKTDEGERDRGKKYQVGDAVKAKYKGGKKLYPGIIKKVHSDGTYDIKYEDGDVETRVSADLIEEVETAKPRSPKKESSASLAVGDAVKARYKGGTKLFPGTIQRVRTDGTYDVKYDDGDVETNVDPRHIELVEKESRKDLQDRLNVGDRVKARYKKGSKFFPGKITKVHSDGSYDIRYEDGDSETRVPRDFIEVESKASSPTKTSSKKEDRLQVGDAVKARYKKGAKLYPGKITRVRTDGTFDVEYEYGDVEIRVEASLIEAVSTNETEKPKSPKKKKKSFEVGDAVMARYKKGAKLFRGTIKRVRSDGTYDIKYEDGDVETSVEIDYIQLDEEAISNVAKESPKFVVGQTVKAKYKNSSKWYPGRISRARSDGSYDIEYDDGERESSVDASRIEATSVEASPKKKTKALKVGEQVKARFKGGKKLYNAEVTRVRTDGTYDLKYEDGDVDTHVAIEMIESSTDESKETTSRDRVDEPAVGDAVKAYYKKGKKLYPGKIVRRHSDETFDIKYDNGDVENRVSRGLIVFESSEPSDGPSRSPKKSKRKLQVGDRVAATHKRSSKRVRGRISRVRSDDTFDIEFDDGETATRVEFGMIEALSGSDGERDQRKKPTEEYDVGDQIKARYKKGTKWFPGKITRVRTDGTYDVKYEDGDVELSVAVEFIEPMERNSGTKKLDVGDKISARYKNGSKWYNGTVLKVRTDGTFDIRYEDGDSEERVKPENIRSISETQRDREDKASETTYAKGDVVEADYKGKGKYRQGRITRVHEDGSLDIEYDNGNTEKRVAARLARHAKGKEMGRRPRSKKSSSDSESDNQEQRQRRSQSAGSSSSEHSEAGKNREKKTKKKIKKGLRVTMRKAVDAKSRRIGRVKKTHSDGSCDIQYKDGDVSKRVSSDALLVCSSSESSEQETNSSKKIRHLFKRDQKVLACWRRPTRMAKAGISDRWDEATVLATSDNGTYSIRYRDGGMEEDVPEEAIKSVAEMKEASRSKTQNDPGRELCELDLVFLLEQLAMTLHEEGEVQKKPRLRFGDTGSSSSSSESNGSADSSGSSPKSKSKKKRSRKENPIDKAIKRLFDAKSLEGYRDRFNHHDRQDAGRISKAKIIDLVEELCAKTSPCIADNNSIRRLLTEWFSTQDSLRTHSKFDFNTFMVAFAVAKNHLSRQKIQQNMANALEARFASHHESKKQLELWQQKLGFRVFETLQRSFHDCAIPRMYPAQIRISEIAALLDQITRNSIPSKPLEVYLKQMQLLPHHTLHLPEFMCCYYQLYGSADSGKAPTWAEQLELRPVTFVASCLFSNGDPSCERHGDLVRRLCIGRTPAQVDLIMRFREVFESLQASDRDQKDTTISSSQLHEFASKVVSDPSVLDASIMALRKRTAAVSLVEMYSTCGFVIDEITSAPTVVNAIEKLRLRTEATEVRRIITLVRSMCLKVLRFPNNPDYWRIRSDSTAFQQKLGRFHGATSLLEAVGFVEYGKSHFELRGARMADGKRSSCLTKTILDTLRERCSELDAELSVMDGVESIVSILQRVAKHREHDCPLTLRECEEILKHLSTYIETILKNPKDSRCWRIRESNKTFQRQIGYLPFCADLMASIGYDLTPSSQGNVYMLRGSGLGKMNPEKEGSAVNASLSNFAFSSVSEQMEWFLWRRKQEIESLLQDDMEYLVQMLAPASFPSMKLVQGSTLVNDTKSLGKMYPYGRNAADVFSKTPTQQAQLAMMKKVFESLDVKKKGFLTEEDFGSGRKSTRIWSSLEAFDLDKDGHVDMADFIGSLGPCLDHTFDLFDVTDLIPFQKMTLSEQVSTVVGHTRLVLSPVEVTSILDTVIGLVSRVIDQPDKPEIRDIPTTSPLVAQSTRLASVKMLLDLCGYRPPPQGENKTEAARVAFTLLPHQHVRFQITRTQTETISAPLDAQTVSRLQLICSMLGGHARAMIYPSISDVGAMARAIGEMRPFEDWVKLVEVVMLCLDNILKHPEDEDRYRQLKTTTRTFTSVVSKVASGVQLFLAIGFRETDRGMLVLPDEINTTVIQARKLELVVGYHVLKIAQKLSSSSVGEPEFPSPTRVKNENFLTGDAAVDYYKKKALAADLAREEALRKSFHLEKQLEIVAKSQSRRLPATSKSRSRSASHQRLMSPTAKRQDSRATRFSASGHFASEADIEAEILAELSPRKHAEEASKSRPTSLGGKKVSSRSCLPHSSTNTARPWKSTQRRVPSAPSSTIAPLLESTLAMDSNAESCAIVLRSTKAHLQTGALVRIGTENRDLTEERLIVKLDHDTHPGLTKVFLHSPLQFPHFTKDLVFVLPPQAADAATEIAAAEIEMFMRLEILGEILDRVMQTHSALLTSQKPSHKRYQSRNTPSLPTSLSPIRAIDTFDTAKLVTGGKNGNQLVLWSKPSTKEARKQQPILTIQDIVSTRKLRSVWDAMLMEFGGSSGDSVSWHQLRTLSRRIPWIGMCRPDIQVDKAARISWSGFLEWLHFPLQATGNGPEEESPEQTLALALLRQHFRALMNSAKDPNGVFRTVSLDELISRSSSSLMSIASSPTEARDLEAVHALLNAMKTTLHSRSVMWSDIVYSIRYGLALNSVELFPFEPLSQSVEPTRVVVDIVCSNATELVFVLFIDGYIEVWRPSPNAAAKAVSRTLALYWDSPSGSRKTPTTKQAFVDEYYSVVSHAQRDQDYKARQQQRISSALEGFIRDTGENRSLMTLTAAGTCLVVNGTMLGESGRSDGAGLLYYHVECLGKASIRPLRRAHIENVRREVKKMTPQTPLLVVSSSGVIASFVFCSYGTVVVFQTARNPNAVLWVASASTGRILACVDEFAWLAHQKLFASVSTYSIRTSMVCLASSKASYVSVTRFKREEQATDRLMCVLPAEKQGQSIPYVSTLLMEGEQIFAAYSDGKIAVWTVTNEAWQTTDRHIVPASIHTSPVAIHELRLLCGDYNNLYRRPQNPCLTLLAVPINELETLHAWSSDTADGSLRLVLYLLNSGEVIEASAPAGLSLTMVTLDVVSAWDDRLLAPGFDRVLLEPEAVVRVVYLVCEYRREGVFAQKSVRELLDDIKSKRVLQKTQREMDSFIRGYEDSLRVKLRCYYRPGDSGDSCVVLPTEQSPCGSEHRQSMLVCGKASSQGKSLVQFWLYSDGDVQRTMWEFEAYRLRRQRILNSHQQHYDCMSKERRNIVVSLKRVLGGLYGDNNTPSSKERIAEAMLPWIERLCLLSALEYRHNDPVEATVLQLFDDGSTGDPVDVLRRAKHLCVEFRPWIQRLCDSCQAPGPDSMTREGAIRFIRQWRRDFTTIEELCFVIRELGILHPIPKTQQAGGFDESSQSAVAQQFCAFALPILNPSGSPESTDDPDGAYHKLLTFIPPRLAVEFILSSCDVGDRIEKCVDVLVDRTAADLHTPVDEDFTTERIYAELLHRKQLCLRLTSAEHRIRLILESTQAPLEQTIPASTIQLLRRILKTSLPNVSPQVSTVALCVPLTMRCIGSRITANAEARTASGAILPVSLVLHSGSDASSLRQYQHECRFYRRVQEWKTRELFLPVLLEASDLPILRSELLPSDSYQIIVCESLSGWRSIGECVRILLRTDHRASLTHWQALVAFWCRQVLLALVVLEEERIEIDNLTAEDVLVSPDCKEARFASVKARAGQEDGSSSSRIVMMFGVFVLELIELFERVQASASTSDDELMRLKHYRVRLMEIWSQYDDSVESKSAKDLVDHLSTRDSLLTRVFLSALLAFQPRGVSSHPPSAHVLWCAVFEAVDDEPPVSETNELAWIVDISSRVDSHVVNPLRYIESNVADTLTASGIYQNVLVEFSSLLTRIFGLSETRAEWAQHTRETLLSVLIPPRTMQRLAVIAIGLFERCLQAAQRAAANTVVRETLETILITLDSVESAIAFPESAHVFSILSDSVEAMCVMSGAPVDSKSMNCTTTIRFQPRPMVAAGLWRMCESSLRELTMCGDPTIRYPTIQQFLKNIKLTLADSVPIEIDHASTKVPPTIAMWWRQKNDGLREDVYPRRRSLHSGDGLASRSSNLPLDILTALHQTLELRFNASTAATAAASKFRLAAMQTWLSPQFLDRRSALPFVFAHDVAAVAWLRLDMVATLCELLRDPDDRIVYGAVSIVEAYTRVFRYEPLHQGTRPPLLERHAFQETSPALQLALSLGSNVHLINQLTAILTRLVRMLKTMGESATSAAISSRYGVSGMRSSDPVALLCVLMSFLVNCLHGGDACTRQWISSGLSSVIVTHAKASSLSFLKIVDASWMNQSQSISMSRPASQPQWEVFSVIPAPQKARRTLPFELLLRELLVTTASRNVQMLQYHRAHSSSFRQIMEKIDTSASPAAHWIASSDFGKLSHVWEVVKDIDECEGTLDEQTQAIEYTKSVMEKSFVLHSSALPATTEKICRVLWSWLEVSWRALLQASRSLDDADRRLAVVLAAFRLIHAIARCASLTTAEIHRLASLEDSEERRASNVFRLLLSLLLDSASTTQTTSVLAPVIRSAIEVVLAILGGPHEDRARILLVNEFDVSRVLRVLRLDSIVLACCCGGTSALAYTTRMKTRLWSALLRHSDRDVTRVIVDDEFLSHLISSSIDSDFALQQDDSTAVEEASAVVNARLEAIAMLEILLVACSTNSLACHLLTSDFIKAVLQHRTLQSEKQRVLSYGHYHKTHRSRASPLASFAIRMVATAKRFIQLVCCLSIDHSTDRVDSAVSAALARIAVPDDVVVWHLHADPSTRATRRVEEFWETWPEASAKPRSSLINEKEVTIFTAASPRARAPPPRQPSPIQGLEKPSDQIKPPVTQQHARPIVAPSTSATQPPKTIPLDELLVVLGPEVSVLEAIFQRHAGSSRGSAHGEKTMEPSRLAFALRECNARTHASLASTPLSFSQFLLQYARCSGLEQLWRETSDTATTEFVWLCSGEWASVPAAHMASIHSAPTAPTTGIKQLVETLLTVHRGLFSRHEMTTMAASELKAVPTKLHARDDPEALTMAAVRRVAAVVLREASRRPAVSRLLLQPTTSPRRLAAGVVAVSPVRASMVQSLVSIDVESACALARGEEDAEEEEEPREREKLPSASDSDCDAGARASGSSSAAESELKKRRRRGAREKKEKKRRMKTKKRSSSSSSSSSSERTRRPPSHVAEAARRLQSRDPHPQPRDRGGRRRADALRTLREVFAKYDADGDGAIGVADLRRVVGAKASGLELQRWVAEKDRRGVGAVDFGDFCAAFASATVRADDDDAGGRGSAARSGRGRVRGC